MKKKVFCLLLTLVTMFSLFPASVFAASGAERNADATLLSDAEDLPDRILIDATEILYAQTDGSRQAAAVYSLYHTATDQTPLTYDYTMSDSSYPADGSYYLHLIAYGQKDAAMSEIGAAGIEKITLGLASSVEEFETAENLTEVLFTDASQTGGGYLADFSQGYVDFTIMDILGDIHYLRIQTVGEIHESTEITAASRGASSDGNETWISASVTLDSQTACATIFCAAYQNGKMMEVFSQTVQNTQAVSSDPASWTETLTFTFETDQYDRFRLFLVDEDAKPMAEAVTVR